MPDTKTFDQLDAPTRASLKEAAGVNALAAATRAAIAAMSSPAGFVYLIEPGREGVFSWAASDLSEQVAADPYQGLFIAPASVTTGASGAWVRAVPDNTYHGTWFGLTDGLANGRARLQSGLDNTPHAATFCMPPFTVNVPDTDARVWVRGPMRLTGYGRLSCLKYTGTPGTYWHQLQIAASDVELDRVHFYGDNPGWFAANPPAILAGLHLDPRYTVPTEISNIKIHDCSFEHTSLAIVPFGHFVGDGAGDIVAPRLIDIYNNRIETNMLGIEIFGADDVRVYGNTVVTEADADMSHFKAPIRVIGSENVDVFDNDVIGASGIDRNAYGIFVGAAGLKTTEGRRSNRNVRVYDNKGRRVGTGVRVDECRGDNVIRDNDFDSEAEETDARTWGIEVSSDGSPGSPAMDMIVNNMTITGNKFRGFAAAYEQAGRVDSLVYRGNHSVGNARILDPAAETYVFNMRPTSETKFGEVSGNSFIHASQLSAGESIRLCSTVPAKFHVYDNMLPEMEVDPGVTTGIGVYSPASVITSRGGAPTAGTAFAPNGSNARYTAGTHAAVSPVED